MLVTTLLKVLPFICCYSSWLPIFPFDEKTTLTPFTWGPGPWWARPIDFGFLLPSIKTGHGAVRSGRRFDSLPTDPTPTTKRLANFLPLLGTTLSSSPAASLRRIAAAAAALAECSGPPARGEAGGESPGAYGGGGGPSRGWSTPRSTRSTSRTSSCGTRRRGRMESTRLLRPRSASTAATSSRRAASSSGCILFFPCKPLTPSR